MNRNNSVKCSTNYEETFNFDINAALNNTRDVVKDINNEINYFKEITVQFREELNKLQAKQTEDANNSSLSNCQFFKETVASVIKEENISRQRERNLVIYNIAESQKENSTAREQEDINSVEYLFRKGVKVERFDIVGVFRLGKKGIENFGRKPRPLLVKLSESVHKWRILKDASNLQYCTNWMSKVGISRDMSKEDQEKQKALRDMLNIKKALGEKGWCIRGDMLVQRIGHSGL